MSRRAWQGAVGVGEDSVDVTVGFSVTVGSINDGKGPTENVVEVGGRLASVDAAVTGDLLRGIKVSVQT